MMKLQSNINKVLIALKMKGFEYFIDTSQFSGEDGRTVTKYIIHTGNPKDDHVIECYSKSKVLESLVFLYKNLYKGDVS